MKKTFFLLLIITIIFACKQRSINSTEEKETVFIKMERTPCYGKCPSYIITILTTGKVDYLGKTYSSPEGNYTTTLSKEELEKLKAKIKAIDFFNFKDKYDKLITDFPTCLITVNLDGKEKQILDKIEAPKELRDFEKMIDEMIITNRLIKIEE
jgi:hypothetical protein